MTPTHTPLARIQSRGHIQLQGVWEIRAQGEEERSAGNSQLIAATRTHAMGLAGSPWSHSARLPPALPGSAPRTGGLALKPTIHSLGNIRSNS